MTVDVSEGDSSDKEREIATSMLLNLWQGLFILTKLFIPCIPSILWLVASPTFTLPEDRDGLQLENW